VFFCLSPISVCLPDEDDLEATVAAILERPHVEREMRERGPNVTVAFPAWPSSPRLSDGSGESSSRGPASMFHVER